VGRGPTLAVAPEGIEVDDLESREAAVRTQLAQHRERRQRGDAGGRGAEGGVDDEDPERLLEGGHEARRFLWFSLRTMRRTIPPATRPTIVSIR
jgi:hypothetical protein